MRKGLSFAVCAFALVTGQPALGQQTWELKGQWGNETGCAFGKGGQTRDDEDMSLLTPEHYENYVTHCSFLQTLKGAGALVVTALCGHEGDDLITAHTLIIRAPADGDGSFLMVTDDEGNQWAEVRPCPQ